jgi:hypothetical protein
MSDPHTTTTTMDKDKKRKKQMKRMGKLLSAIWDHSDPIFQDGSNNTNTNNNGNMENNGGSSKNDNNNNTTILYLTDIGQRLDGGILYRMGKHGWMDFAHDLRTVYDRHLHGYVFFFFLSFHLVCVCVYVYVAVLRMSCCWWLYQERENIISKIVFVFDHDFVVYIFCVGVG